MTLLKQPLMDLLTLLKLKTLMALPMLLKRQPLMDLPTLLKRPWKAQGWKPPPLVVKARSSH